jgi:hypothetical protein
MEFRHYICNCDRVQAVRCQFLTRQAWFQFLGNPHRVVGEKSNIIFFILHVIHDCGLSWLCSVFGFCSPA